MRKLQFKFPNQIRISGWDFGSSARAMNQAGGFISAQADLEKVSRSTTERKSMSTKTTIKRIALVAVSALGFGMVSAVAPASAAVSISSISVGTIPASRAGVLTVIPVTVNYTSGGTESITVAAKVTAAPLTGGAANAASQLGVTVDGTNKTGGSATSASNVLFWSTSAGAFVDSGNEVYAATSAGNITDDRTYLGVYKAGTTTAGNISASNTSGAVGGVAATALQTATASSDTSKTFYLAVRPDLAGTYSILVSASSTSGNLSYVAGDVSTTITLTTAGAAATVTLTNVGGSTTHSGSYGALYKLSFKDAAGNATTLNGDEAFTITPTAANIAKATVSSGAFSSVAPSASTAVSFGAADLVNGVGYLNVLPTAAASAVVLSGAGSGTLSSTVSATASFTSAAAAANAASITFAGAASANNVVTTGWVGTTKVIPTTSTSDTIELTRATTTAAAYGYLTVVDTAGLITGSPQGGTPLRYDRAYSMAAAGAYATVSVAHAACSTAVAVCYNVTDSGGASLGNVTSAASAVGSGTTTILSPASSLRVATGGSVTYSVRVRDQFRNVLAATAVTVTFAGRNSAKSSVALSTNSSGIATYTFTDTGTTGTTDTITFTASGSNKADATITYGTTTAGSVLVATPSTNAVTATTLAGEDKYPKTYSEIDSAGTLGTGAENGAAAVSALVKDANGVAIAGVPVTFTVSGTGCAIPSNAVTGITDATGVATSSVYAWVAGTCVVTATSGGKSDSANSYWLQTGTAEARSVSATVEGSSITATVKDRFGNTIAGVPLKATRVAGSGTGGFGGSSSATGTTDSNGVVVFDVTGGTASVTIGFNPTDGTSLTYGQSDALKGLIDGTSTAAANTFTAYAAGTELVAEEGVGSTFDAAGVNSVTVDVVSTGSSDAIDAANDAVEAANAATDAANAAAEAADAATAAAQDAQAAVADLAAQVATLISGIKAQITRLTNLVIKIQKKVNA